MGQKRYVKNLQGVMGEIVATTVVHGPWTMVALGEAQSSAQNHSHTHTASVFWEVGAPHCYLQPSAPQPKTEIYQIHLTPEGDFLCVHTRKYF